ncbi:MAG: pyridoxal-dependent decarboxylase [Acidimicrobiales bacterium]|jgi:aromatic-L-amino-acid/L-tryptophan decarboxylase
MGSPMFQHDAELTELVIDFCRRRLSLDPVPLDFGGTRPPAPDSLDGLLGEEGNDPAEVLRIFADELARSVVSCDSDRYLAFIPAAPTKAALLFDMIVSCSSFPSTSWLEGAGVVMAENQALRVLADTAGLPEEAGGCFVSGGSNANLSALVVARETASRRGGPPAARRRVALTSEAHASVGLALRVTGLEPMVIPAEDHRLTGSALQEALAADPAPEEVMAVVATAGTTNGGIVDDLASVGRVAREHGLWFHVDGAYGGAALLADSARHLFDGVQMADSYVVDPHKWLFAPYDSAALLYRDPKLAEAALTQHASYLDVMHTDEEGEWNPGDYAFHLTRRARGLPFWFSVAVHGIGAYREAIESVLETTRQSAALITQSAHLELIREPELSVVLFRRRGWGADDYRSWSTRLLREQIAFVTPTNWEGEPVARLAFLHPDTSLDVVAEVVDSMA